MVTIPDSKIMTMLTHVQIHFVKDIINHRLLFGEPYELITLDRFRRLAVFTPNEIFGYIRWRANQYGTVEWRLFVVKSGVAGHMTQIQGISPAVKILISVSGRNGMKRALSTLDVLKENTKNGLQGVPESYWKVVQSALIRNSTLRLLPRHYRVNEPRYVG